MKKIILSIVIFFIFIPNSNLFSCTGFYIVKDETIFFGNNVDWFNPSTKMRFLPSENGKYGRVFFGFDNYWTHRGMNEKGLFFSCFASNPLEVFTNPLKILNSTNKPIYQGNLLDKVLSECSTVLEAIEVYRKYNHEFLKYGTTMFMYGDAQGNSVIIERDNFIQKKDDYQVCTNFYQSKTKPSEIECWRYLKANELLKSFDNITVDLCRTILKAVHVDLTQFSNIYDLKNKKIYLYHFHNFDNVVEIDLLNELKKGKLAFDMPDLFPKNKEFEIFIERYNSKITPLNNKVLFSFFIVCGVLFLVTPIILSLGWRKIAKGKKNKKALIMRYHLSAFIIGSITCLLTLFYLLGLAIRPEVLGTGLPQSLRDLPYIARISINIPFLEIPLIIGMILLLIQAYRNDLWTQFLRSYYCFVTFILIVNLGFFGYWGLIRI